MRPKQATITIVVLAIVVSGASYASGSLSATPQQSSSKSVAIEVSGAPYVSSSPSATPQQSSPNNHTLFQAGAYNSLEAGNYNGEFTLKELRAHGDFGLGAFDSLDGEMVFLDASFYQIKSDGSVYLANDSTKICWGDVTAFAVDEQLVLAANPNGAVNYSELQHYLNGQLSEKTMHAVKMVANCSYCEVRSPQKQTIPYPPLHTALEDQSVYKLYNVTGTFVGFFSPNDSNQVFVPGWHFHFLSAERTRGGHVLDAAIRSATIQVDDESTAVVRLLGDAAFWGLPLTPNFS